MQPPNHPASWGPAPTTNVDDGTFTRQWKTGPMTASVELDPYQLRFAYGIRDLRCEPDRLSFFRLELTQAENVVTRTLVVRCRPARGERDHITMVATNPEGHRAIIDVYRALLARFPERDLSRVPRNEALRRMELKDPTRFAPLITFLLALAVVAIGGIGHLQHWARPEVSELTLDTLVGDGAPTRNVVLSGGFILDDGIEVTKTQDGRVTRRESYFPYVGPTWQPGDPVDVVIMWEGLNDGPLDRLPKGQVHGTLRTAFAEGMSGDARKYFRELTDFTFTDGVVVVELEADLTKDRIIWFAASGSLGLLLTFLIFFAFRSVRRQGDLPPVDPA